MCAIYLIYREGSWIENNVTIYRLRASDVRGNLNEGIIMIFHFTQFLQYMCIDCYFFITITITVVFLVLLCSCKLVFVFFLLPCHSSTLYIHTSIFTLQFYWYYLITKGF